MLLMISAGEVNQLLNQECWWTTEAEESLWEVGESSSLRALLHTRSWQQKPCSRRHEERDADVLPGAQTHTRTCQRVTAPVSHLITHLAQILYFSQTVKQSSEEYDEMHMSKCFYTHCMLRYHRMRVNLGGFMLRGRERLENARTASIIEG